MTANEAAHGRDELDALREEIDELQNTPEEQLLSPLPKNIVENEPEPRPTDAIGSVHWDETKRPHN
ncbi:hypothetical protein GCM10009808_12970 [Microbacterium sediminicola]|uniref:Uncharacterized protein n=1 Tax=Microbacterium sediminicola TaxID=415210 RepID=A0ABN2I1C8_9MICO